MEIKKMKIKDLKFCDYNPRYIERDELEKLKKSIKEFGFVQPLVINKNNVVIGGNQRLKALIELGFDEVDVVQVDLDEEREKLLNLALNKISGEWKTPKLEEILKDLVEKKVDISLSGFEIDEFFDMIYRRPARKKVFELENLVKPGDIWQLGEHKLICDDATKKETYKKLLGDEMVDIVCTDPPYFIFDKINKVFYEKYNVDLNYRTEDEYKLFLKTFLINTKEYLKNGSSIYVFIDWRQYHNLYNIMKDLFNIKNVIIWDKMSPGRGIYYRQRYEMLIFGIYGSEKPNIFNNLESEQNVFEFQTDVWKIKRKQAMDYIHLTEKPVELTDRILLNSTNIGDIVLDNFGGSGTTLISCEKLQRICRMIEINTDYCEFIIKRWENFTGKKAVLLKRVFKNE